MKKTLFLVCLVIAILLSGANLTVLAKADEDKDNQMDKGPLTKITFIHYKKDKDPVKPNDANKPPKAPGTTCYGYLAKGAKWKTTEPYLINPVNNSGLSPNFVETAVTSGVAEWERYGGNIFGRGTLNSSAIFNDSETDGQNVTVFGSYPDARVIAITNIWGYFSGPVQTRQLLEWDMLFNTNFTWGDAKSNLLVMDLQNIATHELGHSAGMNDLYMSTCTLETMYGYSTEGETIKRDLNPGDITGIKALYQ